MSEKIKSIFSEYSVNTTANTLFYAINDARAYAEDLNISQVELKKIIDLENKVRNLMDEINNI